MTPALSEFGQYAASYARMGLKVFPLRERGKEPLSGSHGLHDATADPDQIVRWWTGNPSANVGIPCDGMMVLDFDRHEGNPDGLAALEAWEFEHGKLPDTAKVETGGGGEHWFYRTDRADLKNLTAQKTLGIDVKVGGGYVVAPPSIHPSGEPYTWLEEPESIEDIAVADSNVLEFYRFVLDHSTSAQKPTGERGTIELPETLEKGSRDDTLFKYACSERARNVPFDVALTAAMVYNQQHCDPPLSENVVTQKVRQAYKYSPGVDGSKNQGKCPTAHELAERMRAADVDGTGQTLADGIGWNAMFDAPWKRGPLPWDKSTTRRRWKDADSTLLWAYCEADNQLRAKSEKQTQTAFVLVAKSNEFDPLLDLLDGLPEWDGINRAGHFFQTYLNAWNTGEGGEYVSAVERVWLRQAVARVYQPGIKAELVVVLVGPQGIGKSTALHELAMVDEFFTDSAPLMDDVKRFGEALQGKWIVELGELASIRRSQAESVKQCLSRRVDNFRPSYGRYSTDYPRRCIFAGTSNERGILADETGGRRFPIIECFGWQDSNGTSCPNPALFDESIHGYVQQLWAEVVNDYKRNPDEPLKLPADMAAFAESLRESYRTESPVREAVLAWLDTAPERICTRMVLQEALQLDPDRGQKHARAIRQIIDATGGWEYKNALRFGSGYGRGRGWQRIVSTEQRE